MARKKSDPAHEATDKEIEKIEREIAKEYRQAHKEVTEKLNDYLAKFAVKDEIWRKRVENGEIPEKEYIDWRRGQMLVGKRWEGMCETLAQDYANAAKIAQSITKGYAPEVYAINHNYATFDIEKKTGLDTSYTLYSRETVERMYRENPKIYHDYGKAVAKDIKEGKQVAWDKKRVRSVLTQAVLQGESIPKITKRLEIVTGGDHNAAIRNARTMMTGVQNAGRIDAMNRAQDKGIPVRKQWLATIDGRTRHWHRELDGAVEDLDKPFENSIGKIMFPADPDADGANVYNCRCTLLSAIKGFELDVTDPSIRPMPKLKDMTYEEWKNAKKSSLVINGKKQGKAMSIADALKGANPNFRTSKGYNVNCQRCVATYEYRRRGFDVSALPKDVNNSTIIWGNECFVDSNGKKPSYTFFLTEAQVKKTIKDAPDNARFIIYVKWKRKNSAHVFIADKESGVVKFVDPQSNDLDCSRHFSNGSRGKFGILRIDDKDFTKDMSLINATMR